MDYKKLSDELYDVVENIRLFLEKKLSWYGIIAFERLVKFFTIITSHIVIFLFLAMAMLFASFGAAYYLGNIFENPGYGFLIVGAFYLFVMFILILFRRRIFGPFVIRTFAQVLFKDEEMEDERLNKNKKTQS